MQHVADMTTTPVRVLLAEDSPDDALAARVRQQAAVAELGLQALAGADLDALLTEAVALAARTLGVELCKVLELSPEGDRLLLRAGVGWKSGLVGSATVETDHGSQAGYTLVSAGPVIVDDLGAETRFAGPQLLRDHGVVSGISVVIAGERGPFGVLGAHTATRRAFTEHDANFLQAIANVLASAIARRGAEEQRLELEERLRQAQKMEAVGQLAAGIAHDFNNLLTAIQGYGELVLASMDDDDPRRGDAMEIARAADRAAQLTNRLLTFSRRERARTELIDVSALVLGLESLLCRTLGEQVDLRLALAPSLPPVVSDSGELEQVLLNLAVNARDAMPLGGVLTISTEGLELDAGLARRHPELLPGRYVRLSVADTGLGMTADVKARALEPFFTTKERGYGTGLGLATVWGIVSQAGGALELDSAHGDGTTVSVILPAGAVGAPSPGVLSSASAPVQTGGETVLVVEDEPSVRELISRILSEHGYRVLATGDGAEALALVERHEAPLDLLLTDVVLPAVSGSELAAILTAARPGLKVLAMSGYAGKDIAHGRQLDDDVPFLAKPFSREALLSGVRDALRGGRV